MEIILVQARGRIFPPSSVPPKPLQSESLTNIEGGASGALATPVNRNSTTKKAGADRAASLGPIDEADEERPEPAMVKVRVKGAGL